MSLLVTKNVTRTILDSDSHNMVASGPSPTIKMIITAPKLLTLKPHSKPIHDGAVVINGGTLVAAGHSNKLTCKHRGHKIIHLKNSILMPGLVNVHAHLELPPLLDIIRAASLPEWVLNLIKMKKELNTADYESAARQNIETLIRTGTTTVAEVCTHKVSAAILKQMGIRATIFHEIISMNPSASFPSLSSIVARPSRLIRTGFSPHAPYTVSEKVLREIKEIASQKRIPLCMHVAESKDEVRLLQGRKSGFATLYQAAGWDSAWAPHAKSPFEYLYNLGLLGPRFLGVHAVHTTDRDIALIKKSRMPIAHCPRSNKETGVGRMPLKKFLDAGITVGLGTDSLASSPSLSMWDEMRYAYRVHRRDGITPTDIFDIATMGGAKALGMSRNIGTLDTGKRADIIAIPLPGKDTGDLYSDLLRDTKSCMMTIVNGDILWEGRQ